jgi:hypothetical protein
VDELSELKHDVMLLEVISSALYIDTLLYPHVSVLICIEISGKSASYLPGTGIASSVSCANISCFYEI